jgi:predicted dehydrogenase
MSLTHDAGEVRWGIVGTANIARAQFLPGLREAGGGRPVLVGSREAGRAMAFAAEHGVDRGVAGYEQVVESPDVDAVYVAVPNSLHFEWTARALQAGKSVLCEKLLCVGSEQTAAVLDIAAAGQGGPLWEAFVFPFQAQHQRACELIADGAIGAPAEIVSAFHFQVSNPSNIRLSAELGGGSLADVGCYPVRLACEIFGTDGAKVIAGSAQVEQEVEVDAAGIVLWGTRRLMLTCGFRRSYDTFTRILGDQGQLSLTNPFHPSPADTLVVHRRGAEAIVEHPTTDAHSFTAALRHIHAVMRGETEPAHLASESALPVAQTVEALQTASGLR